ncbi:MAG TPA: penicillin-binding protein activator, partial [Arenicellales bacterium]|nr:penicillin-binding protein activator [Arenicellales bacterium]
FNLSESETRESLLESTAGLNLHLDPRRRQDLDAVFMAARPEAARLLKPQINFFQGHNLPVYSTSHVYSGRTDAASDKDLDGIRFPHMPWVIRDSRRIAGLRNALRESGYQNTSGELFAFGYDAYRLALVASDPAFAGRARLEGLTGGLVLGRDGRIHRRFDWAEFSDGVPVRIWRD